jgi:hypothetical protein
VTARTNFHDEEFAPEVLKALKKREILAQANPAQLVPLHYNMSTRAVLMVKKFQDERSEYPLLETTPPEAWIAAEIVPVIQEVRSKADVDESVLSAPVQRYLRVPVELPRVQGSEEQRLHTTIEPYLLKIKSLLTDIVNRRKSLRAILRLPAGVYKLRGTLVSPKPGSRREAIVVRGIKEKWRNHRIAKELDDHGLKPQDKIYPSYTNMVDVNAQLFYSLKSSIRKKYQL